MLRDAEQTYHDQLRRRRRRLWWGSALGAVAIVLATAWCLGGERALQVLAGEVDLFGQPRYRADQPPNLEAVDLERVHAELFPEWVIQASRPPGRSDRAEQALDALRTEVEPDDNLTALVDEMALLVGEDPAEHAHRLLYLCWAWSEYLDDQGRPWRLVGAVRVGSDTSYFYTKSYQVLSDGLARVGGVDHRVRLVTRADHTNVVEAYLGAVEERTEGALVVVDRVVDLAVDEVWPLMSPAAEGELDPVPRAFAEPVRAEVSAALSAPDVEVLRETAEDRARLVATVEAIRARRDCGSRFVIPFMPWEGIEPEDEGSWFGYADRSEGSSCPMLTREEATVVVEVSRRLREAEGLEDALEALVAQVSRAVAIHELRHVADGDHTPCPGCPDGAHPAVVPELSAYAASFAAPGIGVTALFQGCLADRTTGGSHALALELILARLLDDGCQGGPPPDLYERASALEEQLFARSEPTTLPADYPAALPLRSLGRE